MNNKYVVKNHEIAITLLAKFFSSLPVYPTLIVKFSNNQLETLTITEEEIQKAIFQASPLKRTRHDCIPALL